MGLFSSSSPFDSCVERATSEKNTSDDWGQIMDVCDRVKESPTGSKDCLKSISKRLCNDNPRVVLQTVTLLDACINNCGRKFLLEVAGREFEQELHKLITSPKTHSKVSARLRESLKKWVDSEFKGESELSLIPALYNKLIKEGYEFEMQSDSPKKTVKYSTDPNVVQSEQEEEDIAKAIQLSLQTSDSGSAKSSFQAIGSGLYSSASAVLASDAPHQEKPEKEQLKVRALYDFEAAEDNELTFKAGEIIIIIDNNDANWWKGSNHRGEGLFPANFVTTELVEDTGLKSESSTGKRVSFSECVEVTEVEESPPVPTEEVTGEVDEDKIDHLLHLLHEADPSGERSDDPSLPILEEQVNAMAPFIDAELECIDKKHMQLARISTDLVDALNLYHQLMREMPSPMSYYSPYSNMMPNSSSGPQNMMPPHYLPPGHQNMPPHQMYHANQYPYGGMAVGGMPQYLPPHMLHSGAPTPSGIQGSPNHHGGAVVQPVHQPPTSNFQPMPPGSQDVANGMAGFSPYTQGTPQEYGGMNDPQSGMVSAPSQAAPDGLPPHSFPSAHPMASQSIMPHPSGAPSSVPPQGPPLSTDPSSVPPQGPAGATSQGPPANPFPQGPPNSFPPQGTHAAMPTQGPPVSMQFYPQPPMQQLQQPLL